VIDTIGNKAARGEIAMIKVAAPAMALKVVDDAIQAFGGAGVTTDPGLARMYTTAPSRAWSSGNIQPFSAAPEMQ
jgi:alkylation response protein AidB-like acyl-CoA dehydrogenase